MLKNKLVLICITALILSGCAYQSPVPGGIYTGTTFPAGDKVNLDGETANKRGNPKKINYQFDIS